MGVKTYLGDVSAFARNSRCN